MRGAEQVPGTEGVLGAEEVRGADGALGAAEGVPGADGAQGAVGGVEERRAGKIQRLRRGSLGWKLCDTWGCPYTTR